MPDDHERPGDVVTSEAVPGWDAAIEAGRAKLESTHWDGEGCGTHGTSACSNCYGPSPATAAEVAADVLAAALPHVLDALEAEIRHLADADYAENETRGLRRAARVVATYRKGLTE